MDKVGERTLMVMKKANWYNRWLLTFFSRYLKGDILEIGAGIGNFSSLLKKYGTLTAIDIRKDYIEKYKNKVENYGFGDIEEGNYFFKNRKFDSIVCFNVIEHIKDDKKSLQNIYKLLNKGGIAVILVPAGKLLYGKYDKLLGHYRRYGVKEFKKIAKIIGFNIKDVRYINWLGAIGWLLFIKILKRKEFPESEVSVFDVFAKYFLWPEKCIKMPFGLSVLSILEK